MKNILVLFSVFVIMSCNNRVGFKTKGTRLLDVNNKEFIIRGVNNPHIWYPKESYNALEEIAKSGSNCVRIVWETKGCVNELEAIITKCIQHEIIPMVELHDATGDTLASKLMYLTRYFVQEDVMQMLKKYENYLLINIANEWGDNSMKGEYWYKSYIDCIKVLRDEGYKTTIVIDACGWGQNISPILSFGRDLINEDSEHNLLFSVHMYGSWNNEKNIKSDLLKASRLNLPLIVGEFGYNFREGKNNLGCMVNHTKILEVCNNLEYGYLAWSWSGNNEENSWLDLVEKTDWSTYTPWGQEVFNTKFGIKQTAKKASVFYNK